MRIKLILIKWTMWLVLWPKILGIRQNTADLQPDNRVNFQDFPLWENWHLVWRRRFCLQNWLSSGKKKKFIMVQNFFVLLVYSSFMISSCLLQWQATFLKFYVCDIFYLKVDFRFTSPVWELVRRSMQISSRLFSFWKEWTKCAEGSWEWRRYFLGILRFSWPWHALRLF